MEFQLTVSLQGLSFSPVWEGQNRFHQTVRTTVGAFSRMFLKNAAHAMPDNSPVLVVIRLHQNCADM